MNCEPGDIAVMIRSPWPRNVGRLFRVISAYRCDPGEWHVETLSRCDTNNGERKAGSFIWADDCDLRPIRDPGDDAVDEISLVRRKPEEETA